MRNQRFLFSSVDSSPKIGGVSLLAKRVSKSLLEQYGSEGVYLGPKGTYFEGNELPAKIYEDYASDTKKRAGPLSQLEDDRIESLAGAIIDNYSLNRSIVWHPFYYGLGIIKASKKRNIHSSVFVHGTELTSQIPHVRSGVIDFEYNEKSVDLDQRLYGTIKEADLILVNSHYTKNLVQNLIPEKNVAVVGCGLNKSLLEREYKLQPEYKKLSKIISRDDLGIPERKTLIQIGRLVPHKNQRQSIELISHQPELQLIIVGDGPTIEDLKAYSAELNVSDRVFFTGQIDDKKKWEYLRASDAGLLISNYNDKTGGYEGFGIAMLEYTAAACVVISNGNHGMSDYSERYGCAFLALNDDQTTSVHARRIRDLIAQESRLSKHIQRARDITMKRFTWEKVAARVMMAMDR